MRSVSRGVPRCRRRRRRSGALLAEPEGIELGTVWRPENEVVNRLKVVKDVYSVVPFGGQTPRAVASV